MKMKYKWDKKYLYWGVTAFSVIVASMGVYYFIFHRAEISLGFLAIRKIVMPIIDGLAIAYLLSPVLNSIERNVLKPIFHLLHIPLNEKNKKRMRYLGILLTMICFLLTIYFLFNLLAVQISESVQSFSAAFPLYMNNLYRYIGELLEGNQEMGEMVMDWLRNSSTTIESWLNGDFAVFTQLKFVLKNLTGSVLGIAVGLWNFIIGFVISIYLLNSKELFAAQGKKILYGLFQEQRATLFIHNLRFTHRTFGGFISGKILDSILIGLLCFVGTTLLKMPYPVLISVIIGVTNIIPFFGPYLGAIPTSFIILMVSPVKCLYFILFILVLQQFDGNILGPKILGDSTGLSSFWVIFSITLFGGMWGVLGMVVGVPFFALIYAAIKALCNMQLEEKELSTDTKQYMNLDYIQEKKFYYLEEPSKKGYSLHKKRKNNAMKLELRKSVFKKHSKEERDE